MKAAEPGTAPVPESVLEMAAIWIPRLNSGPITVQMLGDLRAWMQECPENRQAFREMEQLWSRLAIVHNAVRKISTELECSEH